MDGLEGVARSSHVFDKILKIKENYLPNEFKNLETFRYKLNKFDIYNSDLPNIDNLKIAMLFEKYFLFPNNLIQIINSNLNVSECECVYACECACECACEYVYDCKCACVSKHINRITWICMSDKSFLNLTKCFNAIRIKYPGVKFHNVRIVYFGIKDIFQKSNIKQEEMDDFKEKIDSGFCFG